MPTEQEEPQVQLLDLNKIVNSTYNPRKDFREETLLELSESIRQSGVLQPICVRPKDEGFEIVYGERRYWAAAMANLKFIPALVRDLSDAEAEDAAITENLQREDVKPREEAAAYNKAIQSGRHTIESLVCKFGKSEAYIRSRLKLCELIDALAEMLDKEDISVGVATEIAKYPAEIQQEVYNDHFAEGCYNSWKTARIKDIARRLYERYMTKLESYNFDKIECLSCQHNTANQVLFRDECAGGCAGCQNRECMIRKNEEFLVQKALKLLKDDPRTTLATAGDTPVAVLEALEKAIMSRSWNTTSIITIRLLKCPTLRRLKIMCRKRTLPRLRRGMKPGWLALRNRRNSWSSTSRKGVSANMPLSAASTSSSATKSSTMKSRK